MPTIGELSHSGHTDHRPIIDPWPSEWPTITELHGFWFFGILKRGLAPKAGVQGDYSKIEEFARGLNLVGQNGCVPAWVVFCAGFPHLLAADYQYDLNAAWPLAVTRPVAFSTDTTS